MKKNLKKIYQKSTLAIKIRYSYLVLFVPFVFLLFFCIYNFWSVNRNYGEMLNSTAAASEFSIDFKKDFDYETYLLIVGNKNTEESNLYGMLDDANRVVKELEKFTYSQENKDRLESVKKYLSNLEIYIERIEENLYEGNKYEDNIEIWENDVQIVTTLVQDAVFEYIYYEISDIQKARAETQDFFEAMVWFLTVAFAGVLIIMLLFSYYIPLSITNPIRELSKVTDQVAKGDFSVRSEVREGKEVSMLSDSLNSMIDKINELLEQVTKEQTRLRKAEFELLQSQINPHFLYNTLDAIVWLAEAGEQKKVVSMVGSLSEFFRTSLNQGKDIISIREELQHVKSYLEIQQVRYMDIMEYEIQVPGELEQYLIPKITIQPIVENALYHGIKNKRGVGKIRIYAKKEQDLFAIIVEDNGIGISEERLLEVREGIRGKTPTNKDIYGLYNVNERICLNFGEKYGISIESIYGEKTVVSIMLPYINEREQIREA